MSQRPWLAVSASNPTGDAPFSAALALPDRLATAQTSATARGDLAALCRDLCAAHGVAPTGLAGLRLDLGPGSYTGLRVAVTFVRFLQAFGPLPVQATDTLALLAAANSAPGETARLVPLLDARRDHLHCGALRWRNGQLLAERAPAALPVADALALLQPGDRVLGPAALLARLAAPIAARGAAAAAAAPATAAHLFTPGLPLADADAAQLEPHYLLASYAE